MIPVTPGFVLAMMLKAEPAPTPWRDTYLATATAISSSANRMPLFRGEDGPAKSAAIAVGVMWFESHFNPKAEGDRKCLVRDANGDCAKRGEPQSFCAFQVGDSNFAGLGITREKIQGDIQVCSDAGFTLMHSSFNTCSGKEWTLEDRLNQYATGGPICVKPWHDEGGHRMRKGLWLFTHTSRVNAI